jgi:N-acetylglucosamine-6-phosphate deacetylase
VPASSPDTARLGVRAALVDGAWVPGDVLVAGGRVVAVGADPAGAAGVAVPGFVDLHLNGFAGVDFLSTDAAGYAHAATALAATGVTGYLATFITSPPEDYAQALGVAAAVEAAGDTAGARLLGVHLEGPYLSPEWPGAHDLAHLRAPDVGEATSLCDDGPVRMMTLAPELPGGLELVDALTARGVAVSLGHCDADAALAYQAFDRGARAITHLYNAHRRWTPRDPGVAGAALTRPDVTVQAIVDHVHLAPETAAAAFRTAQERFCLVTDGMAAAGQGPGTYRLGRREVRVEDGRAELIGGGLAGSVLTMDEAVRNLVGCGASLAQAVHAASVAPAHLLGRADLGTLRPGSPADVAVLDDDLQVTRTLRAGAEVYAASKLAR